jgi:phosphate-selective porin OprO/OprP
MLHGSLREGLVQWQVAVMNGVTHGGSGDFGSNDGKDFIGRVFVHPFQETRIEALQGFGIGLAAAYGRQTGALSSYRSSGQQTFFAYRAGVIADGPRHRFSPQGYWYWGPFGLLWEFTRSNQEIRQSAAGVTRRNTARPRHDTWQVAASYVLTGEASSFKGVIPRSPFRPGQGWGALEIAAGASGLEVDDEVFPLFANPNTAAEKASSWAVGVNWYLNRWLTISTNYERTRFTSDGTGDLGIDAEGVLLTRFQINY